MIPKTKRREAKWKRNLHKKLHFIYCGKIYECVPLVTGVTHFAAIAWTFLVTVHQSCVSTCDFSLFLLQDSLNSGMVVGLTMILPFQNISCALTIIWFMLCCPSKESLNSLLAYPHDLDQSVDRQQCFFWRVVASSLQICHAHLCCSVFFWRWTPRRYPGAIL